MQNINDIWNFINFVTNKYSNGYVSPNEVSQSLDIAQNMLWNNYIGKRNNGNELALIALQPFYNNTSVTSNSVGLALYPSLWAETQGIYIDSPSKKKSIRQVLHNEVDYALRSAIYPIAEYPRYLEQKTGVQLYPSVTTIVDWHYLSKPTTPVMGYTVTGNEVVYNPITSVQLQFATQYWSEVIALALQDIGVNLANPEVSALVSSLNFNANNGNDGN